MRSYCSEPFRRLPAHHLADAACPAIVLLGDPTLCNRYRLALSQFRIDDVQALNETGPLGLWRIAVAAGLAAFPSPRPT